jgi:IS605 OrfB family transposase
MITILCKLTPTTEQQQILRDMANEYIKCVNMLSSKNNETTENLNLTTAKFQAELPSAVKNEALNTALSVVKKYRNRKCNSLPVLRKPIVTWNNQNYKIKNGSVEFPVWLNNRTKRMAIKFIISEYQEKLLAFNLGSLRISQKNGKWMAQIAVDPPVESTTAETDNIIGVDLGLKNPAVAVTSCHKTKFFGNGRLNKFQRRVFKTKRKKLGKAKKQRVIKKIGNKERRWMKDQDHKISRGIVDFAKENSVSVICLEDLQNIRQTARTSRKNEKNLHTWSFYRLALYIQYKAHLLGIKVVFVNPHHTSQTCPKCGKLNHARDRKYKCSCGFKAHRDRVGAMNILKAPVVSPKRKPA